MTFYKTISRRTKLLAYRRHCTYGHHSTRAAASDKDTASITLVLVKSVSNHVGDRVAVAATIVGERSLGRDIPASSLVRRLGVDDDETVLLGEFGVRRASVIGIGSALAVVDGNNDRGLSSELVRDVDVHLGLRCVSVSERLYNAIERTNVGRVGSIVGHLLQRCGQRTARKSQDRSENRKLHVGQLLKG
jgi:hypothetical protein